MVRCPTNSSACPTGSPGRIRAAGSPRQVWPAMASRTSWSSWSTVPTGKNQGLFRVGRALDGAGAVTGGWTPWIGGPGLVLPPEPGCRHRPRRPGEQRRPGSGGGDGGQPRRARTRGCSGSAAAWTATAIVTGGWTPWIPVPDWFSRENQGIAVAVAPPDGQGQRDLIVFMVDNPAQTEPRPVPDRPWPGRRRHRRPVDAVDRRARLVLLGEPGLRGRRHRSGDGAGRDLVVFQVDNAVGQNQAFYRIGKNLGADGIPARRLGRWMGVPDWFSWENQGGGIAATAARRRPQAARVHDRQPAQKNAGLYEVLPLDPDPARDGAWELLPFHSGVLAVHAALLPDGKVLFFAGSGSSAVRFDSPLFGDEAEGIFTSVVWDPPGNDFAHPPTLRTADGTTVRLLLRRRRVPARRPHAVGRRHPGLRPVQGPQGRRHLRLHHRAVVLRRPDGARTLVPDPDPRSATAACWPPPG